MRRRHLVPTVSGAIHGTAWEAIHALGRAQMFADRARDDAYDATLPSRMAEGTGERAPKRSDVLASQARAHATAAMFIERAIRLLQPIVGGEPLCLYRVPREFVPGDDRTLQEMARDEYRERLRALKETGT